MSHVDGTSAIFSGNQVDIIRQYAADHNVEIVRVYSDHGRSGLNTAGREGLNRLMANVAARRTDFTSLSLTLERIIPREDYTGEWTAYLTPISTN